LSIAGILRISGRGFSKWVDPTFMLQTIFRKLWCVHEDKKEGVDEAVWKFFGQGRSPILAILCEGLLCLVSISSIF